MTSNAAHTPGRIYVEHDNRPQQEWNKCLCFSNNGDRLCFMAHGRFAEEWSANARRLVACWNAAHDAGLSTEALEAGVVKKMAQAIFEIALVYPDRLSLEEAREAISSIGNLARAVLAKLADFPKQSQEERG